MSRLRILSVVAVKKNSFVDGMKNIVQWMKVLILFYFLCPANVLALWWAVGGQLMLERQTICRRSRRVGGRQDEMCRNEPEIVDEISMGVQLSIDECQIQFENRLWNCTTEKSVMSKILKMDTRESAYLQSIISAGILHAVAEACSKGRLLQCSCDSATPPKESAPKGEDWVWGGCADDVGFAFAKSKDFVDVRKLGNDFGANLQLHNYESGRLASSRYMRTTCKCHGLSGSCALKTCWRRLPLFSQVGERLKDRYDGAIQVTISNNDGSVISSTGKPLKEQENLVYSQPSPDYCRRNKNKGSLGTAGRTCDPKSIGLGGCDILCCGRGYRSHQTTIVQNCKCKFTWCCEVVCQTCHQQINIHKCR